MSGALSEAGDDRHKVLRMVSGFEMSGALSEADEAGSSEHGFSIYSSSGQTLSRQFSEISFHETDEDDHEDVAISPPQVLDLGPLISLKDQLEKDKDDESLRKWKEQLLGSIHIDSIAEGVEPEVKVLSLSILSPSRPDLVLAFPSDSNTKGHLFTLKEGTRFSLKFTFLVRRNIVSGLKFLHTVWKMGRKVDNSEIMLGTFSPQLDPYTYIMEEETTPSGILARGSYRAKIKFIDDDGRCHVQVRHTFDIKKEW